MVRRKNRKNPPKKYLKKKHIVMTQVPFMILFQILKKSPVYDRRRRISPKRKSNQTAGWGTHRHNYLPEIWQEV
jgi:hypothetical protein